MPSEAAIYARNRVSKGLCPACGSSLVYPSDEWGPTGAECPDCGWSVIDTGSAGAGDCTGSLCVFREPE